MYHVDSQVCGRFAIVDPLFTYLAAIVDQKIVVLLGGF